MAEATGSSPVSSTPQLRDPTAIEFPAPDSFGDLKKTVPMEEFDAKLAQYVRRAEGGGEILVTRWGRRVAKLVPAHSGGRRSIRLPLRTPLTAKRLTREPSG